MIPYFPSFKCLTWNDREEIEQFTNGFPPYSDFNFTSLYSWNLNSKIQVAQLYNNLVVKFSDYLTGKPFLSFIGKSRVHETAGALIKYSQDQFREHCLKLVPEAVAEILRSDTFIITPDRDAFDYIYSTSDFKEMNRWPCKYKVAGQLRAFIRNHPDHCCICNVLEETDVSILRQLYAQWAARKGIEYLNTNEYLSFERLLQSESENIYAATLHVGNRPAGFVLFEVLSDDYSIVHFIKGNTTFNGIYEALQWRTAQMLLEKSVQFINFEQDMGIESLRRSKEKYKLHVFLRKYTIQKNTLPP